MADGFFTKGIEYDLPHPPISQRTILLLCKVLRTAWQLLKDYPPENFQFKSEKEDKITQFLVEVMENRLRLSGEVDGFNRAVFGKVIREPKITNFNKEHPDKMPDILFELNRGESTILSEHDGLFVECKPVDKKHKISSCYCQKGLIRFVNGDYAWAMQEALMVGYVTGHYSFDNLATILDESNSEMSMNTKNHTSYDDHEIYHSTHERTFEWLENRGKACPITVSHLWLSL